MTETITSDDDRQDDDRETDTDQRLSASVSPDLSTHTIYPYPEKKKVFFFSTYWRRDFLSKCQMPKEIAKTRMQFYANDVGYIPGKLQKREYSFMLIK